MQFDWAKELIANADIIREELNELRSGKGFQPYKSPLHASDIKVKNLIYFSQMIN